MGNLAECQNFTHSKSMGILDYIKCRYSKTGFWKKLKLDM